MMQEPMPAARRFWRATILQTSVLLLIAGFI
jgi:hypothetical protein